MHIYVCVCVLYTWMEKSKKCQGIYDDGYLLSCLWLLHPVTPRVLQLQRFIRDLICALPASRSEAWVSRRSASRNIALCASLVIFYTDKVLNSKVNAPTYKKYSIFPFYYLRTLYPLNLIASSRTNLTHNTKLDIVFNTQYLSLVKSFLKFKCLSILPSSFREKLVILV